MHKCWKIILTLLSLTLVTGCWDQKDIQSFFYVTAFGIDYVDDRYIVYAQLTDLTQVAKVEGVSREPSTWVGIEEGEHIEQAIRHLNLTSQQRLFWNHTAGIVLHERILKRKESLEQIVDYISRYREFRENISLWGTSENLEKLLSTDSIFDFSPFSTLLLNPKDMYEQYSLIPPYTMKQFIIRNEAPYNTAILPTLTLREDLWSKEMEPHSLFEVNGAHLIADYQHKGWMSTADLLGLKWMSERTVHTSVDLLSDQQWFGAVDVLGPKIQLNLNEHGEEKYRFEVRLKGTVSVMNEQMNDLEIAENIERTIHEQIQSTYAKALSMGADVYNLRNHMYRKSPTTIQRWSNQGERPLPANALEVKVAAQITYPGKRKIEER
jgi:Ger(x)C family germination protein